MAAGNLKPVSDELVNTDPFAQSELTLYGTTYQFRELDAKTYDECTDLATLENGNIDTALLLKVMLPKSVTSPKLTEDKILAMPMGLRRSLLTEVDRLHFPLPPRPSEEEAKTPSTD